MEVDWLELWRELAMATSRPNNLEYKRIRRIDPNRKPTARPDPLLDLVLRDVGSQDAVIEIGPGSGRWSIPIAKVAKSVTIIEPSVNMLSALCHNVADARITNIKTMQSSWEAATVEVHDLVVCAHAMYSSPDLAAFVNKMASHARKRCYLAIRLPAYDGIIGELSLQIYGRRHDSPNAIIAYNALYSLGICANILVEDFIYHWVDSTIEEAFTRAKRHLRLESTYCHDELIRLTLTRRLTHKRNLFVWPDGMRSALLWWSP